MSQLLEIEDLDVRYGSSHVVRGVSLSLGGGEGLAIFGRNGVGKTTLVHSVMGFIAPASGSIRLEGLEVAGQPTHQIARAGLSIVPQGRRLFPNLTVYENLALGAAKGGAWTVERVYELLPRLAERRKQQAGLMSGGEQQMVAIGRALLRNPKVLLLDEPSEGLAPRIVDELAVVLRQLRSEGMTLLVVEQNLELGVSLAERVLIMDMGQVVYRATVDQFRHDREIAHKYLGVV